VALRERADDIPLLVEYFTDHYSRNTGKSIRRVPVVLELQAGASIDTIV
jgi:transcriptional regulator with AAA-type ATPase domain